MGSEVACTGTYIFQFAALFRSGCQVPYSIDQIRSARFLDAREAIQSLTGAPSLEHFGELAEGNGGYGFKLLPSFAGHMAYSSY